MLGEPYYVSLSGETQLVPDGNMLAHNSYLISDIKKAPEIWRKNDSDLGLLQCRWGANGQGKRRGFWVISGPAG